MKLAIFDFDDSLFKAAYPPDQWDPELGDWWALDISLGPPVVPEVPGPEWWNQWVVEAARERIQDPGWYCCCLTGRSRDEANFIDRIPTLLSGNGLDFDEVHLSPADRTAVWKIGKIQELAKRLNTETIELWDDRADHLQEFRAALEPCYSVVMHHVQESKMQRQGFRFRGHRYVEAAGVNTNPQGNKNARRNPTAPRARVDRDGTLIGGPDGRINVVGPQDRRDQTAGRKRNRNRGATARAATAVAAGTPGDETMMHKLRIAEDPELVEPAEPPDGAEPSESEMVEQLEEEPGANWRDLYLQPIIRAIRNRFDLERGQVKLLGPKKKVPFGSDTLGFEITGHVRFKNFEPPIDPYGTSPYRFTAHVDPNGELQMPVGIMGG